MANVGEPAVSIGFVREVLGILIVVADVATTNVPFAVERVEIATLHIVINAPLAYVTWAVEKIVIWGQVQVDGYADVHAAAAVRAERWE